VLIQDPLGKGIGKTQTGGPGPTLSPFLAILMEEHAGRV
jgi:hypothetical protein